MMEWLLTVLIKGLAGAGVRWLGCEPTDRQRVYFANHTSNLDACVIWAALPTPLRARTRPVAAQDYWTTGHVRRFLAHHVFRAVLIERKHVTPTNNPLRVILAALDQGHSLIIFPEGGRVSGDQTSPFKSGLYHMARERPTVEFIPVYLDNMNRILPKGEILPVPLLSCISFGTPIQLEPEEGKLDFLNRAREAVYKMRHP